MPVHDELHAVRRREAVRRSGLGPRPLRALCAALPAGGDPLLEPARAGVLPGEPRPDRGAGGRRRPAARPGRWVSRGTRSWGRPRSRPSRAGCTVDEATAGVDGTVVLRYHSVPCLRARPAGRAGTRCISKSDPVPFIRLRPPARPRHPRARVSPGAGAGPTGAVDADATTTDRTDPDRFSVARSPGKESAVPAEATGAVLDFDRHFRRAVWITTLCVIVRRGRGLRRQGRRRSQRLHPLAAPGAPVLGRREHLRRDDVPQPADHADHALPVHAPAAGHRGALLVRPQGGPDGGLGLALLPDGPPAGDADAPVVGPGGRSCS